MIYKKLGLKKALIMVLCFIMCMPFLIGCGGEKPPNDGSHTFVGEFSVYNEADEKQGDPYSSVFAAIDEVGVTGKIGYSVKDESGTKVFERGARNVLHKYTKTKYYGSTTNTKDADTFLAEIPYSHVIIGSAGKYYGHSVKRMNSDDQTHYGEEVESGSYVYQFAKPGYLKATCTVKLSEVKYRKSKNPNIKSNVYIFFNSNGAGGACDMGIMSGDGHDGKFYAVTNGFEHPLNLPFRTEPITTMTYNEETDEYSGADDLYMEYTIDAEGVHMILRNLKTNVEQIFHEKPSEGSHLAEKYATTWENRTMLHATSYVPDLGKRMIWDPLNGGYFNNMVYEDVKIWETLDDAQPKDWYPSSPTTLYGFAYADDGASYSERTVNAKKQVIHNMFYTMNRV